MPITDPPLSPAMLDRLVLRWRRNAPSVGTGPHQRRRQGHSLEFREYRAYQRGDDIRGVDWRASARQPRRGDLLLRSFEAEQQMTLAILIDNRPEMALPETMPRLLYALWAMRALVMLALDKGDEVLLARLFAGPGEALVTLRGADGGARARDWAEVIWAGRLIRDPPAGFADLRRIADKLRPAGAAVVLSDMLFDDPGQQFVQFARQVQTRRRSLSVLQLDSVQHEIALLRRAAEFRLIRPDQHESDDLQQFDEAAFRTATDAVAAHTARLRQSARAGGLDWPLDPVAWPLPEPEDSFQAGTERLKSCFVQDFPRLPLLANLSFGGRE
ncbi:MAG: hypothetical protein A3D16_07820 [Rhodobacterales bacterium RIFCSPHIGHO2_02_FULL_62_130]|nr:MAG: hypothetical protein A3D16_07820 [Rhodobacterales bacterium RIFCSPHIGHO2_02_FULL_62_130]OHC57337.1 MAG: hypothetical protein A3E48_05700 [Rhodobacterales bacterium RIFCSPHIGHO2_12_FULL_62_75]